MTNTAERSASHAILELRVQDHPGVMSHVSGLFARRAFNLEGILCMPNDDGTSTMWLRVAEDARLHQVHKQLDALRDVLQVQRHGADPVRFDDLERFFRA
jgi:acetolactate synthase-1/3 small subunit